MGATGDRALKSLRGFLPIGKRPRCMNCSREMTPAMMTADGHVTFSAAKASRVGYGYMGNGYFCKVKCGYLYGLRAAARAVAAVGK